MNVEPHEPQPSRGGGKPSVWRHIDAILIRLLGLGAILLIGAAFWRVATAGHPSATTTVNDSLVQMAQWAITTVFAAGAALIGLNWYQGEQRYQRDRQALDDSLAEVEQRLLASDDQIANLSAAIEIVQSDLTQYIEAQVARRYSRMPGSMTFIYERLRDMEYPTSPLERSLVFAEIRAYVHRLAQDGVLGEVADNRSGLQLVEMVEALDPQLENDDARYVATMLLSAGAKNWRERTVDPE